MKNSTKLYNEGTKHNQYYQKENDDSLYNIILYEENITKELDFNLLRKNEAKKWLKELKKIPINKLYNDIIYFKFKENMDMNLNELGLICTFVDCKFFTHTEFQTHYCVFHNNQETPHLHRILLQKDKK